MDLAQFTFKYAPENLRLFAFSFDNAIVLVGMIALIAAYGLAYALAPYIYGYLSIRKNEQEKQEKRRVIQDLILMKEIQWELEKEMEQALLNAALISQAPKQS